MPKSKRSKLVSLTQTDKKGRENKERIFDEVRKNLDEFRYVWVLNMASIRTPILQELRSEWAGSKIIMGKQKVLQKALGITVEEEYKENISQLAKFFDQKDNSALLGFLFTNEEPDTVTGYFETFVKNDYVRANSKSPIDYEIPEGVVYSRGGQIDIEEDVPMQHTMYTQMLNTFKVPVTLKQGKIFLDKPYHVVSKGETLDVRQSLILKAFGIACAEYKIGTLGFYDKEKSEVSDLRN